MDFVEPGCDHSTYVFVYDFMASARFFASLRLSCSRVHQKQRRPLSAAMRKKYFWCSVFLIISFPEWIGFLTPDSEDAVKADAPRPRSAVLALTGLSYPVCFFISIHCKRK
jgi:hypothetical protein